MTRSTLRHRVSAAIPLAVPVLAVWLLATCSTSPVPGTPAPRTGDEISVCGQLFHTGTPVVLWNDPGGYDAYRVRPRFSNPEAAQDASSENDRPEERARYSRSRRHLPDDIAERVEREGWHLDDLKQVVHTFVLHYDACGTSRQCFKVLQDVRHLSVHFLLDVDGTIYQTLDLKERAWHAAVANDASVGIEIAHIGAFSSPDDATLQNWYREDQHGPRVVFPERIGDSGVRTPGFVPRPARAELQQGTIQGATYYQYDFTNEQYEALTHLTLSLHRIFPRLKLRVPRDPGGGVRTDALSPEELEQFEGVIGHWHVTRRKIDPGPAFDWERLLEGVRRL